MGQSNLARLGTGITVAFHSITLELYKADPPDYKREFADVTHMQSVNTREFIAHDLYTPGGAQLDVAFDPSLDVSTAMGSAYMTIFFPTRTAADGTSQPAKQWSFSAALAEYKGTGPMEEKMTASMQCKALGKIYIT